MSSSRLQNLPQELRDQVYDKLALPDKSSMLKTCRSIHFEVSPLFYKEVIFRMQIGVYLVIYPGAPAIRPPPQPTQHKLQNLDMFWDLRGNRVISAGYVKSFQWISSIHRKRCRIFFAWDCPPAPYHYGTHLWKALRTLTEFETVEFRVRHRDYRRYLWCDPAETGLVESSRDDFRSMGPLYDALRIALEPTLGVAVLHGDEDGKDHRLTFHPRRQ
ncbi:hypothetical protein IMSHALPRED_004305 [Imshaugia aleurites]|uniref:F-box domain-containing protein n=1 Tax=Imshaugia aleurites TaxID=172621 RepID=A0A8H3F4M3_9LECA|nr:hypothetical protein IMSHALPRED_004305 [Imshaugia aleurites]